MNKGILVIGSLNIDMSLLMKEMPMVGETILGKDLDYSSGGKGANQACAIGKLGGRVKMLGCVGSDNFGDIQKKSLEASGVDVKHLKRSETEPTGTAVIYVNEHGNNSIVVIPGANNECNVEYLEKQSELFDWCDYVLLQMEIPFDTITYAAHKAKEKGKIVILNPAPAPDSIPDELLRLVDYLTPNETELLKLSGLKDKNMESIQEGAEILLNRGVKTVIVTVGEQGVLLVKKEISALYPAQKVVPVDTTAAGDCFNGAFLVALSEGKSEGEALQFANRASAITVTRKGAQNSIPFRNELDKI